MAYDKLKEVLVQWRPRHELDVPLPYEPEQTFLLGSKWADYGLALAFACAFPVVRGILRSAIYQPAAARFVFKTSTIAKLTGKQQERLKKWNESCWKLTVFLLFTVIALSVSYNEPWFWDTRYFWLGCKHFPPCNLSVSHGVLLFYCVETGFYLQAIHFLIFHEVRRKDWLESMVHHIATLILLGYSYYVNFVRVGIMVLLVHDVSDIFLEAAKLAKYTRNESAATGLFVAFMTVWIVTRNFIFPFVLIRSTLTETLYYAKLHNLTHVEPHYSIINGLLLLLEVLHIYWTWLIMKIAWRQVTQGETRDIREEDEDDD